MTGGPFTCGHCALLAQDYEDLIDHIGCVHKSLIVVTFVDGKEVDIARDAQSGRKCRCLLLPRAMLTICAS